MTDLTTLAARIEAGTAEQQRALLEAAWHVVRPEPPRSWKPMPIQEAIEHPLHSIAVRAHADWRNAFAGYQAKLAADAYESAAMMLVPMPGKVAITPNGDDDGWQAWVWTLDDYPNWHTGNTMALAIAAAALRAHTDGETSHHER